MIRRIGQWLRSLNVFVAMGCAALSGAVIASVFWGGFTVATAAMHSDAFCLSCHEMSYPAAEYEHSAHFMNAAGVRAGCGDCHVPTGFIPLSLHMVASLRNIWGHLTGVIDTPAKFEAHRLAMARSTWAEMEADGASGCRTCHSYQAMNFSAMSAGSAAAMHPAVAANVNCVTCHRGFVHRLPAVAPAVSRPAP